MTTWHRNEYVLKGLFLGLWAFFALQVPTSRGDAWIDIAWVLGWTGLGLLIALLLGTGRLMARGAKPWQNWKAFPILVLLESPGFIYAGIMLGLTAGVFTGQPYGEPLVRAIGDVFGDADRLWRIVKHEPPINGWLNYCAVGGAILGFGLYRMRQMEAGPTRFWLGLLVAAGLVYIASEYVIRIEKPDPANPDATVPFFPIEAKGERFNLGLYLLLGLPFFYLLTFSGESEESEVEIMTVCATLGVALYLMNFGTGIGGAAPFLIPVVLYFVYATWWLPPLRVFKHILRGFSYMNLGRLALAMRFFRRALELNPQSDLARAGLLRLHNNLTPSQLDRDPDLVDALDFSLCLDRATALLMSPPTATARAEAEKFLSLVETKKPAYLARVDYLRAVSQLHAKDYDGAAETLSRLLNPETPGYHTGVRRAVYFDALVLAVDGPKALVEKLDWPEFNKPGRRIEAIAAVERKLIAEPNNATAKEYRTFLYSQLNEGEYIAAAAVAQPTEFNYAYVEQLGYSLADDNDPDRRERGLAYLRMAGRGLPDRAPSIFRKLADVTEKRGDATSARGYLELVRRAGVDFGPSNLDKEQKDVFLKSLQKLATIAEKEADPIKVEADAADSRGDAETRARLDAQAKPYYEAAIADLQLYRDSGGGAVLESYRKIAELYAKQRDPLNALINCSAALQYDSTDADLLSKRDSYYYSVPIERLERARAGIGAWFDVGYCVKKAMGVLNAKEADADLLDWATHLVQLAKVIEPKSNRVRLVEARCHLRRGDRDTGLVLMEDVRESEKGSGDEEEAWYNTTRLLGQLYLEELNRPDLALKAYSDYKNYHKSGADTLYHIARCYEALNDSTNALRFYNAVTAFSQHPLYHDAEAAIRRLKGQ